MVRRAERLYRQHPDLKVKTRKEAVQFINDVGIALLFPGDPGIVGIATDASVETTLPVAHLDDIPAIAAMMQRSAISVEDVLAISAGEKTLRPSVATAAQW